jgi:hypothetical protein
MKIRTITAIIAILLLVVIPVQIVATPLNSTPQAVSLSNIWSAVGSTVVVDEASQYKYRVNDGYIEFKGFRAGWIKARINLEMTDSSWNYWTIVYTDPDGAGTAYRMRVKIYRVKTASPNLGMRELVTVFDSNAVATATGAVQRSTSFFTHSWDYYFYAYYIEIDLYRSRMADNVRLYSIQLEYVKL